MARLSQRWQDSILQSRNQSCGQSVLDSTFPIMPWITPALDPKLEALILRIVEPGEISNRENSFLRKTKRSTNWR